MSYFEFYNKNIDRPLKTTKVSTSPRKVPGQKNARINKSSSMKTSEATEIIKGTCLSMCPDDEVLMRQKTKMVHILEVIDDKRVLVKCYSRSAADSTVAVPQLLRPYKVLLDTVQHLLLRVIRREDVSVAVIYDFVTDRLRAVRQDMTVQRLPPSECVTLLEPMIRFHVYFGYKLCEYPVNIYDPVLNKKILLECIKWFLSCSDSMEHSDGELNLDMALLSLTNTENSQSESYLKSDEETTKCDRVLMESLYILCNLDDVHPMYRYWNLPKNFKSNACIKLAYEIAVANMRGNYVQVCKQLDKLCPLTYCALCLHLPTLQRKALLVMSAAYSSKQLTVPLRAVCRWLHLSSDDDAARLCAHYGLRAEGGALKFAKSAFNGNVAMHRPSRLIHLDQKIDLSAKHVFTYTFKDYTYGV